MSWDSCHQCLFPSVSIVFVSRRELLPSAAASDYSSFPGDYSSFQGHQYPARHGVGMFHLSVLLRTAKIGSGCTQRHCRRHTHTHTPHTHTHTHTHVYICKCFTAVCQAKWEWHGTTMLWMFLAAHHWIVCWIERDFNNVNSIRLCNGCNTRMSIKRELLAWYWSRSGEIW
jgi:hypothetical protein